MPNSILQLQSVKYFKSNQLVADHRSWEQALATPKELSLTIQRGKGSVCTSMSVYAI